MAVLWAISIGNLFDSEMDKLVARIKEMDWGRITTDLVASYQLMKDGNGKNKRRRF